MFMNIIIGAGPSGLQLAYFFEKYNMDYIVLEKETTCGSKYLKFPHSKKMLNSNSSNYKNFRDDYCSLLNEEKFYFNNEDISENYQNSKNYYEYLNNFYKKFNLKIDFQINVQNIQFINEEFVIKSKKKVYFCKKLILATGMSESIIPNCTFNPEFKTHVKHYNDFSNDYFINEENLEKYKNKDILIIGAGNSAFELTNILNKYTSHISIHGKKKNFSFLSRYNGDINSQYLSLFESIFNKNKNSLVFEELNDFFIFQNTDITTDNYKKFFIIKKNNVHDSNYIQYYDEIIFCTGNKFDSKIFNKGSNINVDIIHNKYPKINYNFQNPSNENLYFIGSISHSLDYNISSGNIVSGYRFLIKHFFTNNFLFLNPDKTFEFKNNNLDFYIELTNYIFDRINNSSALFHANYFLCDIFFFNDTSNKIFYYKNILFHERFNAFSNNKYIHLLKFVNKSNNKFDNIGIYDKFEPTLLHPEIHIMKHSHGKFILHDKIVFQENLFCDFSNKEIYLQKIYNTLKSCHLLI